MFSIVPRYDRLPNFEEEEESGRWKSKHEKKNEERRRLKKADYISEEGEERNNRRKVDSARRDTGKSEMMRDISGLTIANDSILFVEGLLVNHCSWTCVNSNSLLRITNKWPILAHLPRNTSAMPIGRSLSSSRIVPFETRGCNIVLSLPIVYLSDGHRWPSFLAAERHGQI